jgi:hypothetical protein
LFPSWEETNAMIRDGFQIEAFKAGKGLWKAGMIRDADWPPAVIGGVSFPEIETVITEPRRKNAYV